MLSDDTNDPVDIVIYAFEKENSKHLKYWLALSTDKAGKSTAKEWIKNYFLNFC